MVSQMKCENGHRYYRTCREAARQISEHGNLGHCTRCGEQIRYIISLSYPYSGETVEFDVLGVHTILSSSEAEEQGWDPMILLMKQRDAVNEMPIWPYYWTKNRVGNWANGQFPPLLSVQDLKSVMEKLENIGRSLPPYMS